jgi:ABC-2 type transport system ATP-binding protein
LSQQDLQTVIKVPRETVTKLTAEMLSALPVEDLTIEDPSIEDVIENVYINGSGQETDAS